MRCLQGPGDRGQDRFLEGDDSLVSQSSDELDPDPHLHLCLNLAEAHNHCLATGGAVQQLMGEYVDQVELTQTKTRTESMSSDGYASDDSNTSNESTRTVGLNDDSLQSKPSDETLITVGLNDGDALVDDSFQSKHTAETLGNAVGSNKLSRSYFCFSTI